MTDHCKTCDRPLPTPKEWVTTRGGDREDLCWGACMPADWRARALRAEGEVVEARELARRWHTIAGDDAGDDATDELWGDDEKRIERWLEGGQPPPLDRDPEKP